MKIKDILAEIEEVAPIALQESYDNSGVQLGDVDQTVTGILISLDITEEVIDEAIELECNLVIAHHPLLFKSLKSLTGRNYIERSVIKACKHDIVIYAAHTNLDNAFGGVSYKLASKLGLQNIRTLAPQKNSLLKLATFVPLAEAERVRSALFNAGAGKIGRYDSCSYNLEGKGTFRAGENTQPFCGEPGAFHTEKEVRIETVLPVFKKSAVLRALYLSHPYEEPAYDLYPLMNDWEMAGSGVIGDLPAEEDELRFLNWAKDRLQLNCIQYSQLCGRKIKKVALCSGSGAFLIRDAIAAGADVFITGEAKYNDFYDVEDKILLSVIGHYESEICTKELFFEIITKKITNFAVHFSNVNVNPINYLT